MDEWFLGDLKLQSRLILGTGRYRSLQEMRICHENAETEMVTVALRRIPVEADGQPGLIDFIDTRKITLLANTSGAYTGKEALRLASLALELEMKFLKIEVMGEQKTLLPDPVETLNAVKMIRSELGNRLFLMVYTSDDPVMALKLKESGADAIMPAGSPIGSGRGIANPENILMIRELLGKETRMIIDAGIGSPSDAAIAMELGADAVLLNTAVAAADNAPQMASAMKHGVIAGRMAYLAGRIPRKRFATASSPL